MPSPDRLTLRRPDDWHVHLRDDAMLNEQMGKTFVDYLCHIKEAEIARFNLDVSEWEHREYFDMF